MKRRNLILLAIAGIAVIIQFIRPAYPEKTATDGQEGLLASLHAPENVATIIMDACYDCHSYEYTIPWYGKIAPTYWFVRGHVEEGLEEFNISKWTSYSRKAMAHKLEEAAEMVSEGEMPLNSYTLMHGEARLSDEQRKVLSDWFMEKYNGLKGQGEVQGDDHDHDHDH